MLFVTKRASRLLTPESLAIGMAKILLVVGSSLVAAVVALTLLYLYARSALAPFGLALAVSFLAMVSIELFKFGGVAAVSGRRR